MVMVCVKKATKQSLGLFAHNSFQWGFAGYSGHTMTAILGEGR